MDLGPQNHNKDGLLGAQFIMVVYVDPPIIYPFPITEPAMRGQAS